MSSTDLDRSLVLDAVRVTEAAAIAAWTLVGRGDEKAADQAAVDAMRTALNELDISGEIVIGEGERDEAPMLYIGEKVGSGKGPLAVRAWAPKGTLLNAPDTSLDTIACGPGYAEGVIDLDATPAGNVEALAKAKGVKPSEITVCVLDRPRHADIITSLRGVGARVLLITDGDVAGVIHTGEPETGIDLYIGQGGAPEGVLACAALKCVGGQFQGRLVFRNSDERARAERLGVSEFDKKYTLHEIVRADAIFAATGVTKGAMLDGVRYDGGVLHTHSLVMNSSSRTVREVRMKRPV